MTRRTVWLHLYPLDPREITISPRRTRIGSSLARLTRLGTVEIESPIHDIDSLGACIRWVLSKTSQEIPIGYTGHIMAAADDEKLLELFGRLETILRDSGFRCVRSVSHDDTHCLTAVSRDY